MGFIRTFIITIIELYQKSVAPLLGPRCRFYPSCSTYMKQAVVEHGIVYGIWLGTKRILRCHPLSSGGVDLVPRSNNQG